MLKRNTFSQKTIIIADRAFEGYNLIAHCLEKPNVDFLIRGKSNRSGMREVAKLPMQELDCTISFTITTTQTKMVEIERRSAKQLAAISRNMYEDIYGR